MTKIVSHRRLSTYFFSKDFNRRLHTFGILLILATSFYYMSGCQMSSSSKPLIVAHRGGTTDYPENTLLSFEKALENQADIIEISVQLTKDQVPVLYRPQDLSSLTNGRGKLKDKTLSEIEKLNAGWSFKLIKGTQTIYPYRAPGQAVAIPTLKQALQTIPPSIPIILDLKSLPAQPLVEAVAEVLTQAKAWRRVHFYSTMLQHFEALARYPQAERFEPRDVTRTRLVKRLFLNQCDLPPPVGTWVGIELYRALTVFEKFTLGQGNSPLGMIQLWTPETMRCFKIHGGIKIFMFGINTREAYQEAKRLGAYAVMVDSPKAAMQW